MNNKVRHGWLLFRALCEMARYEGMMRLHGSGWILRKLRLQPIGAKQAGLGIGDL